MAETQPNEVLIPGAGRENQARRDTDALPDSLIKKMLRIDSLWQFYPKHGTADWL